MLLFNLEKRYSFTQNDVIVYFLFIPLILGYHIVPELKPVFYFMPFAGILYVSTTYFIKSDIRNIPLFKSHFYVVLAYLFASALSIFFVPDETEIYWSNVNRDIVIVTGPLLLFSVKDLKFKHIHVIMLLLTSFLCYVIWINFDINWNFMSSLVYSNYDFVHEYHFGSVVCIFVIYFMYKKDYKFLAVAILLMLLVNKRANLLGIFPAIFTFFIFFKLLKIHKYKYLVFILLLAYYFTFYLVAMNIEDFTKAFLILIDKEDVPIDTFLTGRLILIKDILPEIYNRGIVRFVFGNGVGQAEFFIWKTIYNPIYYFYTKPFLLHNDFLKLHFDVGFMGVIIYFFVMYYIYACSNLGYLMFFSFIPLFLIDNTLIFSYNIIIACIIARVDEDSKPYDLSKLIKFTWHG